MRKRIGAVVWKDLVAELRRREVLTSMLFFAALLLTIFNFAMGPGRAEVERVSPGLLWVAILLTTLIGLGRSFVAELENDCLEALLLTPGDRGALFLGKLMGNLLFTSTVLLVLLGLIGVFFNLDIWPSLPPLLLVAGLGVLGLSALGTLFSAMTANVRAREVMLPLLLFPLSVPLLMAGVEGTRAILQGPGLSAALPWLKILGGFDLIFLIVAYLSFEVVIEP